MKASELRELNPDQLVAKGQELRAELFNARVKKATGQLENAFHARNLRREIARVETVIRERERAKEREAQQ